MYAVRQSHLSDSGIGTDETFFGPFSSEAEADRVASDLSSFPYSEAEVVSLFSMDEEEE